MSLSTIIAVGSGGFLGAVARVFLTELVNKTFFCTLPIGTLVVNVLGSFLLGLLFGFFNSANFFSPLTKTFLTTGFLGAMTTYSTFALESFFLLYGKAVWLGVLNIFLNVFATILFAAVGYLLVVKLFS